MDKRITYLWQMERGSRLFRIQTTDPQIARKLRRTNKWKNVMLYCNISIWIFQKNFRNPQDARKKLKSLCKVSQLNIGEDKGEYFAITYANTTSKNKGWS